MIEELRPEDYNTMMLEEKIQNLEIEKKKKVEEIKTYKSLLATKNQNALNPLDQIMMKRKRDAYLKSDAGAIKEEIKEQVLDADRKKIHVMLSTEQKKEFSKSKKPLVRLRQKR